MTTPRASDLPVRHRTPEIMDDPGLDPGAHAAALRGLDRIHWVSRPDAALWPRIAALLDQHRDRPLSLLDVACGGGVVALALAKRAVRHNCSLEIEGCDKSPRAVEFSSRRAASMGLAARFFECDVLAQPFPKRYDIVICSLFLHHLDDHDAIALLKNMAAAATQLVMVDDLVRGRVGYVMAWVGCRVLSRSPVVHFDGLASVAAAYNVSEAQALADRAGLIGAAVTRHWPQRFLLSWSPR